jgi:class 3 adenylate cyclase
LSIRYRLFLWIASLFLFFFVLSIYLEKSIATRNINRAKKAVEVKIIEQSKANQNDVQNYLSFFIADNQAQVDSLLLLVSQYPQLRDAFAPTVSNEENQTWFDAATLIMNNKWIAYFQNTDQNKTTSLIIPDPNVNREFTSFPLKGETKWVRLAQDNHFFVGIPVPGSDKVKTSFSEPTTKLYILLDWPVVEKLLNIGLTAQQIAEQTVSIESYFSLWGIDDNERFIERLFFQLKIAQEGIEEKIASLPQGSDINQSLQESLFAQNHSVAKAEMPKMFNDPMIESRIEERMRKSDETVMIWALSALNKILSQSFDPYNPLAPIGMVRFVEDKPLTGFFSKDVFDIKAHFNDGDYYQANAMEGYDLAQSIAVIAPGHLDRIYLGNTLHMQEGNQVGYITVATNGNRLLQNLSELMHQDVILVTHDKVITAYTHEGKQSEILAKLDFPLARMSQSEQGLVTFGGVEYYYTHLKPFEDIDLHFYTFTPKEIEFALISDVNDKMMDAIHNISFYMQIGSLVALALAMIVLHNLARSVTRPIVTLAAAAKRVGGGELEDIELPKVRSKRKDEISILCNSFKEMISGLKEKEQVKGVLNKVVSPDIAKEILQSPIHLGGEERRMTILFADIRHFTPMTEHMSPQDVITLLNSCMSRISTIIDRYHGVIDKYVGDAVMAVFGIPTHKEESTLDAVLCAMEIISSLTQWNEERKQQGLGAIAMGIGVHTGNVIVGNMGSENRLNYTVIGSNVNLASRLCSVAAEMQILVSEEVAKEPRVANQIQCEALPPRQIKGFESQIVLYEIKGKK